MTTDPFRSGEDPSSFSASAPRGDGILVADAASGRILEANPALDAVFGCPEGALEGSLLSDWMDSPADLANRRSGSAFVTLRRANGVQLDARLSWHFARRVSPGLLVLACRPLQDEAARDIQAMRARKRAIIHSLARTDPLTGLPNRTMFVETLTRMQDDDDANGACVALLLIDVDHLRTVNSSLGRAVGDDLLSHLAKRIAGMIGSEGIVARLEGGEFSVLFDGSDARERAQEVAQRLIADLRHSVVLVGRDMPVSVSIGIAANTKTKGWNDTDVLFAHADHAMHRAKLDGGGGIHVYSPDTADVAARHLAFSSDLYGACERGEMELYFQPKVDLDGGRVTGAEALLRWRHPRFGLVAPDAFVPIAEESGLIVELGRWVLQDACRVAVRWNRGRSIPFRISVNLSRRQFLNNDIVGDVRAALTSTGCRAEWLECEITETLALSDDCAMERNLSAIRALGVCLAMDDFGKGYSSLSYLHRFPLDVLKIDRLFITRMEKDARQARLVQAVVAMAEALTMKVVAEGIENTTQVDMLRGFGCQTGQGYLFGRPVPSDTFERIFSPVQEPMSPEVGGTTDRVEASADGSLAKAGRNRCHDLIGSPDRRFDRISPSGEQVSLHMSSSLPPISSC